VLTASSLGGSFFNVASKDESATKNCKKISHTRFVLTRAPGGGQIDRDEARSTIGAQKHHAGDMPAGNARGFRHGCLSLEVMGVLCLEEANIPPFRDSFDHIIA
jgi:hypothetical protein